MSRDVVVAFKCLLKIQVLRDSFYTAMKKELNIDYAPG